MKESVYKFLIERGWEFTNDVWFKTLYRAAQQMIINGQVIKQEPQPIRCEIDYIGEGSIEDVIFFEYVFKINGVPTDTHCIYDIDEFEQIYKNIFNE